MTIVLALASVACMDDETSSGARAGGQGGASPPDEVVAFEAESFVLQADRVEGCDELMVAYSGWLERCGRAPLKTDWQHELASRCGVRASLPGVNADAAALRGCAQQVSSASCEMVPWKDGGGACGVCKVPKEVGETCGATSVCRRGSCVDGVCRENGLGPGELCPWKPKGSACQESLFCEGVSPEKMGVCRPRVAEGQPCQTGPGCQGGLACVNAFCQTIHLLQWGDQCHWSGANDCDFGACQEGTCLPRSDSWLAHGASGGALLGETCSDQLQACGPGLDCNRGADCDASGICHRAVCGPLKVEGETCEPGGCEEWLFCDDPNFGVCRPLRQMGESCGLYAPCRPSLSCQGGTCQPLSACFP